MPQKCCVPGCKSNYNSQEYISVFTFPSDPDLKEKWVQLIGRKDYVVNKNSVVCAKHFQPDFVVTVDCIKRDDGSLLSVPRTKPKLKNDAFPTIFPHTSSSSSETSKKIKTVSGKFDKHGGHECGSVHRSCVIKDSITSFQSLCREINSHIHHWNSDLPTASQHVERTQDHHLPEQSDRGEAAYIALRLEFLEQQRKYMHTFTDHYIDRMITEGESWARNTDVDRPGFTEMCQGLDKAVEFLCLMCEELSSTVTADIKDGKLTHPEHCHTSPKLPDSGSGDDSVPTTCATSDTRQTLKSGPATGMYCCPHCSTVFSHHGMLYKHITETHSDGSSKKGRTSVDVCAKNSNKKGRTSVDVCAKNSNKKVRTSVDVCAKNSSKKGRASVDVCAENISKTVQTNTDVCAENISKKVQNLVDVCAENSSKKVQTNVDVCAENSSKKGRASVDVCAENISKKVQSSADICSEYSSKSVKKEDCHQGDGNNKLEYINTESPTIVKESCDTETGDKMSSRHAKKGSRAVLNTASVDEINNELNVTDDRNHEGNQKQKRPRTVKKSYKSDVGKTGYGNVGRLQAHKRKQTSRISKYNISVLTEASTEKKIQENSDVLTNEKLHVENENSNEGLEETNCANETNPEVNVIYKCRTTRPKTMRRYTLEKPYKCDICEMGFKSPGRLLSHKKKHQGGQSFQCDICDAGFDRSYQLKAHMSKHTGIKPFHCDVCAAGFTVKSTMQIHMRKHTGEKPYVCDDCGAEFANRRKLKIHRISHTGEKPYKCDVCGAGFNQAFSLQLHKRKHTGEKPYDCDICGLKFAGNCSLKMHRRRHTGEKPYRCDICGVGFTHNVGLQIHKSRHRGDKPYICEICGLKFSVSYSLQYHKRKHSGLKLHKCDVCDVTFSVKTSLLNHRRKHTGETPYNCDICGLSFSVITSLQNHRRKHTGEKPYLCDICGTEFSHSGSLRDHKRLHTGEKPYKCGLCGADFSNRKKLQRHRKVHSEPNLYTSATSGLDLSESEAVLQD